MCYSSELTPQIERWGLQNAGFDYDIVAVFGSQSTGKSNRFDIIEEPSLTFHALGTLLNRLFGTNFDVMDETRRQQTTKGAHRLPYYNVPLMNFRLQVFGCVEGRE